MQSAKESHLQCASGQVGEAEDVSAEAEEVRQERMGLTPDWLIDVRPGALLVSWHGMPARRCPKPQCLVTEQSRGSARLQEAGMSWTRAVVWAAWMPLAGSLTKADISNLMPPWTKQTWLSCVRAGCLLHSVPAATANPRVPVRQGLAGSLHQQPCRAQHSGRGAL